jgi:hypothetical protein
MDELQKARCALALKRFGRERVVGIGALIAPGSMVVPVQRVYSYLDRRYATRCWISADGTLHVNNTSQSPANMDARDMLVLVYPTEHLCMRLDLPNDTYVHFSIWPEKRILDICIVPWSDEDLEGVALVQALMSGVLAQILQDGTLSLRICVSGQARTGCTNAGMKAQITPLLPFASLYMFPNVDGGRQAWISKQECAEKASGIR